MQTLWLADNPLDLASWKSFEVHDILKGLRVHLPVWPKTARLYHKHVAVSNDVTPGDERATLALRRLPGPFYVVVYPEGVNLLVAGTILLIAFTISALTQDKPKPLEQTFAKGSSNNQLSQRENVARLNQRIPDILGVVRSVPDLIQYPYTIWENNEPVEYSYMCASRGLCVLTDIKDGDIEFENITRASAVVYPPGQSPGGGTPQSVVGTMITENVYTVIPVPSLENKQLRAFKALTCYGSGIDPRRPPDKTSSLGTPIVTPGRWRHASFKYLGSGVGEIEIPTNGTSSNVTSLIQIDDELQIIWGTLANIGPPTPDLSAGIAFGNDGVSPPGPYPAVVGFPANGRVDMPPVVVTAVTVFDELQVVVTVSIHASQQAEWAKLAAYAAAIGGPSVVFNKNVAIAAQSRWIVGYKTGGMAADAGVFINDPDMQELWVNFVAPEGLYAEDTVNRVVLTHTLACFITPCDASAVPTADPTESFQQNISGSMLGNQTRGVTVKFPRNTPGRCLVQFACTSTAFRKIDLDPTSTTFFRSRTFVLSNNPDADARQTAYTGQIHDDVEIANCYSVSTPVFTADDITTIHTRVVGNPSSKRVEKRQLNCRAARATLTWNGTAFTTPVDLGNFTENILMHVLKDPFICNLSDDQIDFQNIENAFSFVREHFGDPAATRFSYTLDDHNMSAEETIATICSAAFVIPYRQGDVVKCSADVATDASTLLFNHRNKFPGSETRSDTFGRLGDNDGVEQDFIDRTTGPDTYVPPALFPDVVVSPVSPLQSRIVGLRERRQAVWHGHRQQARLSHQNLTVEFEGCEEAGVLRIMERILVEDNTRPDVQDGEVEDVAGLVVRTSQPVDLSVGTFTMFVQHAFGAVEAIPVTAGPDSFSVTLGHAPGLPLNTDADVGLVTKYTIARDQGNEVRAFQLAERSYNTARNTHTVTAINYSFMYYHADSLMLFLPISSTIVSAEVMFDRSAYETPNNGTVADSGVDAIRGFVYEGDLASPGLLVNSNISPNAINDGYTKSCWIKKTSGSGTGTILSSTSTGHEFFEVDGSTQLRAGHGDAGSRTFYVVTNLFTLNVWHHCVVTYGVGGDMNLYLDGELVDSNTGVPNRTISSLTAFNSTFAGGGGPLVGQADNLRHYCRVLTHPMIRELYQKELFT